MRVRFGNANGIQTLGEVVKMNPTKAKVRTLEARGYGGGSAAGSIWNVPYSMMRADNEQTDEPAYGPVDDPIPNAADQPMPYNRFNGLEHRIMEAILITYSDLSPEALTGDGEHPLAYVRKRQSLLNSRLRHLFGALGRPVSESVAYEWQRQHQAAFAASH